VNATRATFLLLPLVGVLAFDPVAFDFHAVKFFALALVAAACLVAAFAKGLFAWTDLSLPLWVFAGVRGIELLLSQPNGRALRWYALLLALVFAHHVIAAAAPRRWLQRRLVPLLGALGGIVALFAIVQFFSDARQAHSFFANRNFAGAGLAMLLPYALAQRGRAAWLLGALIVAGILATTSRGGMLACACVMSLFAARRLPRRGRIAVILGLPLLVLAGGIEFGRSDTVRVRVFWYEAGLRLGAEEPFLGHGSDGFAREYPPIRDIEEHAISGGRSVHAVHNDYLQAWADGGMLGLAGMLLLVVMALRAARRREDVLLSWIAFAVVSLVDLPWRDPALLTIAIVPLSMVAERRKLVDFWLRPAFVGMAIVVLLLPDSYLHWRADRAFGRSLRDRDPAALDEALRLERGHPQALIARSRPEDLDLLLEQQPHHAGAYYNQSLRLPDDEAQALLRETLAKHDPHHTLTHIRLARLMLAKGQRAQAIVVLNDAIAADPRPVEPYLWLSRILREANMLDRAEHYLDRIPPAAYTVPVLREMLEVELANLRDDLWDVKRMQYVVGGLPPLEVQERIDTALERGDALRAADPRPKTPRRAGERPDTHLERVAAEQTKWKRRVRVATMPDYREAFLLAEALCRAQPTVVRLRQKARAARGLGDVERAGHFESQALYLEALDALVERDTVSARRLLERALLAYPDLGKEPDVVFLTKVFGVANRDLLTLARELLKEQPLLLAALADAG